MAGLDKRGKTLTKPTRSGKKIHNAEGRRQIRLLSHFYVEIYQVTRPRRSRLTDVVDSMTRSRMMSGIRGKNTKPELALRKALHSRGFRYRLNDCRLPGRPDLVLPKYRTAILVHGCFWHRHEECRYATSPSTRPEFWQAKFDANTRRDREVQELLTKQGWRVATVWECALKRQDHVTAAADLLASWLPSSSPTIEIPPPAFESSEA
jgi:DNA mismatch endonuclease (patch repair protein)